MKVTTTRIFLMLTTLAVVGFACKSVPKLAKKLKTIEYTVTPNPMEVHGDSVEVTVEATVPPKTMYKKAIVKVMPSINYGGEVALKPVMVAGTDVEGDYTKIDYKLGGKFTYTDKIAYKPEMKVSDLNVTFGAKLGTTYTEGEDLHKTETVKLADGMITTSLLVKNDDQLMISEDDFGPQKVEYKATVYFELKSAKLRDAEKKGAEIKKLKTFVTDKKNVVKGIRINSYASPDGETRLNANLTKDRTKATFGFLVGEFKKMKITQVYDSSFAMSASIGEDFEGMVNLLEQTEVADKAALVEIARGGEADDVKEDKMRQLKKGFNDLKKKVFPKLRRSEIIVLAEAPLRKDEEILRVGASSIDSLTVLEELRYAFISTDLATKKKIYKHFSEKYPNDWRGFNNLAVIAIQEGKYSEAQSLLEKAAALDNTQAEIHNNLGVVYRRTKAYTKAAASLKKAQELGATVNYNMAVLAVNTGDYKTATSYFVANKCNYNAALAYDLKGDYSEAKNCIKCMEVEKLDAAAYYLSAIIAARQGNETEMTTNLTRAIQLDSKYRDMAKADLEFKKYAAGEVFKNAIR